MKPFLTCILGSLLPFFMQGQSFLFDQIFQPSIRISSQYNHDFGSQYKDQLNGGFFKLNCIIPIKSKLQLKVDWKKVMTLRLKKSSRLKAYQLFWNFRPEVQYLKLDYQQSANKHPFGQKPRLSYGFSSGITGIHLLPKPFKRPRFLLYSLSLGMLEDRWSIERTPTPNVRGFIGLATLKSIHFYWYFGLYLSYNNGQFIPAPFFGIQARLAPKLWLDMTLPIQLKIAWKATRRFKLDLGLSLVSFTTPFGHQEATGQTIYRCIMNGFRLKTGLNLNFKLGPQTKFYVELGCFPYQNILFRSKQVSFVNPELGVSFYGALSLFYAFKKSLLSDTIDGIIMF